MRPTAIVPWVGGWVGWVGVRFVGGWMDRCTGGWMGGRETYCVSHEGRGIGVSEEEFFVPP